MSKKNVTAYLRNSEYNSNSKEFNYLLNLIKELAYEVEKLKEEINQSKQCLPCTTIVKTSKPEPYEGFDMYKDL